MLLFDAHNHLQDERFDRRQSELLDQCRQIGVARMVVNGSGERDWPAVAQLAQQHPDLIIPSFGYHPWHVAERSADWLLILRAQLQSSGPAAAIGEIGLDRWKPGLTYTDQEAVFLAQLQLAVELDRPVSIHCLKVWGRMVELLRAHSRPSSGFLLHSYGGPVELIESLAELGAYFGFPGSFLEERKVRQRETFRHVPRQRLVIETDAPDQCLPGDLDRFALRAGGTGQPLNHPANLIAAYRGVAGFVGEPVEALAERVGANFRQLFRC